MLFRSYAGQCRKVKGNIIAHPIVFDHKAGSWIILPSQSVNQFKVIPGCMPLMSNEDTCKDFKAISAELSILTYEETLKEYPLQSIKKEDEESDEDPDPSPSPGKGKDHEIEKILDHLEIDDDDYDYQVKWKGDWGPEWDTWHNQDDLADCEKLITSYWNSLTETQIAVCMRAADPMPTHAEGYNMSMAMFLGQAGATTNPAMYRGTTMSQEQFTTHALNEHQIMALAGVGMITDNLIAAAVEYKVQDFMQMPGGPEAVKKELDEMHKRRFNTEKAVPQHLKRSAMECRILCTMKRDGTMKARLVLKDLKAKRKLPDIQTYAAVPSHTAMRLLIAAADGAVNIVSTTDYKVAYLQSPNRADPTTWLLVKYKDPKSGEWIYLWLMGDIYGGQTAGLTWKDHRTHVMVVQGGFEELYNMESAYYQPEHGVSVSVHVDDPS